MMINRSFISFRPYWRNRRRLKRQRRRGRPASWRRTTGTAVTGTVGTGRTVDRRRRCCRTTTSAEAAVVSKRMAGTSTGWRLAQRRPSSGRCTERRRPPSCGCCMDRRRTARRIDYRSTTGRRPDMASKSRCCMVEPSTVGQSTAGPSTGKPSTGSGRRRRSTDVPSTG